MKSNVLNEAIKLADNAMLRARPELFYEWDFEKNDELGLDVYKVSYGSNFKVWWNCKKCGSDYDLKISHKTDGSGCRYCSGQAVNHTNSLVTLRPDLVSQWNPIKNGNLTPHDVTLGNNSKVWWTCPKCKSDYNMATVKKVSGQDCCYCNGNKVNHTNSLATLNPELAKEWHPTKNGKKTPNDVTLSMNGKVWWLGECGHEYPASTNSRTRKSKSGCPYCAKYNASVLIGFNDMWTTNPELAKLLADPNDGFKYLQMSGKRVNFQCPNCENIIENRVISSICGEGLSCPMCSDGVSFPERFVYSLLKEAKIDFEFDREREWSGKMRYDFYLPDHNWIVEIHGIQHYKASFKNFRKRSGMKTRTLEEEVANDELKKLLSLENGIDKYIVIDARESTVEWIKDSILNSDIMKIVEEVDFIGVGQLASSSLVKTACDYWNSGIRSILELGEIMKVNRSTVTSYLKRGAEIGWCDYSVESSVERTAKSQWKSIVQLSLEQGFIKAWNSLIEASQSVNIPAGNISDCLNKRTNTAGGFFWLYKEEYESLKDKLLSGEILLPKTKKVGVVQLDMDSNFIRTWESGSEAARILKINTGISSVCSGKRETCGGFKWMYEEDYKKNLKIGS